MALTPADMLYARALIALGIATEEAVRAEASAAQAAGLGLREHLARSGRVTPAQDARVRAALTPSGPAGAPPPSSPGPTVSGRGSEASADPPTARRPSSGHDAVASSGARRVGPVGLPRPGATVGGHQVERELARGGAGAVFTARDPAGRPVALKVLLAGWRDGVHVERFRREAELGARLAHPGIVKVLDHGEDDGRAWLTMELLEGALPMHEFAAARQLGPRARVELVMQACDALQYAHEQGAIHRDLKPQNLLVTPEGRVKVVDLGLARLVDEERLTQSGATMGTVEYMAPEQVRGDTAHADARTDVWALGVVLFELLAGEVPFTGETAVEVMRQILEERAPDLDARARGLPRGVAAVLAMALSKDPEARHPTAVTLGRDLAAVLAGTPESSTGWSRARATRARGVARRAVTAALVALLTLGGVAAAYAVRERRRVAERDALLLRLAAGCDALLGAREGSLRADGPARARALADTCAALAATGRVAAPDLARAAARVAAADGLVALAGGDEDRAAERLRAAAGAPERPLLEAAVAAVSSPTPAARDALERAIAAGARAPELRVWRALCVTALGPLDAAAARLALADLDLAPAEQPGARLARARALAALGRVDDAEAALAGLDAPPALRWTLALAAAERAIAEQDLRAARAALDRAPGGAPPDARARAADLAARARRALDARVRALAGGRVPPEARPALLDGLAVLVRLEPDEPAPRAAVEALLEAACAFSGTGDLETAVPLADLLPGEFEVQRSVAVLAERGITTAERRRLLPALRRAVALAPPAALPALGPLACTLFSWTGDYDECLAACDRFLPLVAADDDPIQRKAILLARARARRNLGAPSAALPDLDEALRLQPLDVRTLYERALARLAVGQADGALDDAATLLGVQADASNIESDRMAALVWDVGRPRRDPRVRLAAEQVVKGRPMFAGWWVRLALVQLEAGEREAAAGSLLRAAGTPGPDAKTLRELDAALDELPAAARAGAPEGLERVRALVAALDARRGPEAWRP